MTRRPLRRPGAPRRVDIGLPAPATAWIGLDPGWTPPDEVGAVLTDGDSDPELRSCLAQTATQLLDDVGDDGPGVLPLRMAIWVPARWDRGLDGDQRAAVLADLADQPAGTICQVGLWWRAQPREVTQ